MEKHLKKFLCIYVYLNHSAVYPDGKESVCSEGDPGSISG